MIPLKLTNANKWVATIASAILLGLFSFVAYAAVDHYVLKNSVEEQYKQSTKDLQRIEKKLDFLIQRLLEE